MSDTVKAPDRALAWMRRIRLWGSPLILIGVGVSLHWMGHWSAESGRIPPSHFMVVIADSAENSLDFVGYASLDQTMAEREERDQESSLLIPEHLVTRHPTTDTDLTLEVRKLSSGVQQITIGYEIGLLNHGWSTYRAYPDRVEPLEAQSGVASAYVIGFVLAAAFALLLTVVIAVHRVGLWLYRRARSR